MKHLYRLMLLLTTIPYCISASEDSRFQPSVMFKLGLNNNGIETFQRQGQSYSAAAVFSTGIEYQFSPHWSTSLYYSEATDCIAFCNNQHIENNQLTSTNYEANLYFLVIAYQRQLSDKLSWHLFGGGLFSDEQYLSEQCSDFRSGAFGNSCQGSWQISETAKESHSAILYGAALNFQFSLSWGLQLRSSHSNLHQGFNQTGLLISYTF